MEVEYWVIINHGFKSEIFLRQVAATECLIRIQADCIIFSPISKKTITICSFGRRMLLILESSFRYCLDQKRNILLMPWDISIQKTQGGKLTL